MGDYAMNQTDQAPTMDEIHTRLLEMMKALHQICEANNITYYIIGGTALGARRHKGFIPWDDDVDIGMPRPEYERFASLNKNQFPEYLERRWHKNTEKSPFQFIKLVDNRTTLIEPTYFDYVEGLYIDVFPLDGANPSAMFEKLRWKRIWLLHNSVIIHASTRKADTKVGIVAHIVIKKLNGKRLHAVLEKALNFRSYDDSPYFANFLGAWGEREVIPKEYLGVPTLYKFEDSLFYGPERIDDYLTNIYGDFMTPPPPDERTPYHNYPYINLNMPFRDYERMRDSEK